MSDEAATVETGDINVVSAEQGAEFASPTSAAKALAEHRWKRDNPNSSAESADDATAETESEAQAEDTGPEEVTGETQANDQTDELSPIEPPRSWSKEAKERWNSYTRDAQEEFARVEQGREREFLRGQQEVAERRKAVEAEHEATVKVKQQYESSVKDTLKALEEINQSQYPNIKSMADIEVIAAAIQQAANEGDTTRASQLQAYLTGWQTHQMRLQSAKAEADRVDWQNSQERNSKRSAYEAEQNKLLRNLVPEMADTKKAIELRERAVEMLTDDRDIGMKRDQLERWMASDVGHEILSHAGFQKLVADNLKYRDMLKAPKAVVTNRVPPVQRPGPSAPRGAAQAQDLRTLNQRLTESGDVKDAVALLTARRKAS